MEGEFINISYTVVDEVPTDGHGMGTHILSVVRVSVRKVLRQCQ